MLSKRWKYNNIKIDSENWIEGGKILKYDVIIIGSGLAGLTAASELVDAGKKVLLVDQEGEQSLGGQAFWSFGRK